MTNRACRFIPVLEIFLLLLLEGTCMIELCSYQMLVGLPAGPDCTWNIKQEE